LIELKGNEKSGVESLQSEVGKQKSSVCSRQSTWWSRI